MSDQPKSFFDVWFIAANSVMKEVPYHVVTDWVQQTKLSAEDRVKPSGTADWFKLGSLAAFQPHQDVETVDLVATGRRRYMSNGHIVR